MPEIVQAEETVRLRSKIEPVVMRSDFMRPDGPALAPVPNCKLIEQDPNSSIAPHFHQVDQFQIVTSGGGTIGKTRVRPLAIHFTGPHSPYGPIAAEEYGLAYFVARNRVDPGIAWMPQERAKLRPGPRRHLIAGPVDPISPQALRALASPSEIEMIAPEADGLAAWLLRLPPHARRTGHDPSAGDGLFHFVVSGSLVRDGGELRAIASVHVAAGEAPLELVAGPGGAEVITLRFPAL